MKKSFLNAKKKAFTLVEVMLAVGVIAVSITSMIGLLGAITANITQIRHQQKAASCVTQMETVLRTKRFDDVFRWVSNIDGDIYRVNLSVYQNGLMGEKVRLGDETEYGGGSVGGDPSSYALSYLPLTIEVFAEPRQDITKGMGDAKVNEERRIFQGVITKLR